MEEEKWKGKGDWEKEYVIVWVREVKEANETNVNKKKHN